MKTILLIEADPIVLRLEQQILREAGFAADWVSDGQQARTKLKATPYHGIVLNLAVPGGDGLALAEQLGDANRHTPLVIVGSDEPDARKRAFEAGALAFLSKPFSAEAFRSVIHSVISPEGPRAPASPRMGTARVPAAMAPLPPVVTPPPSEAPPPTAADSPRSEDAIAVRFQDGPVYWSEPIADGGWRCGRCEIGMIAADEVGSACNICQAQVVGAPGRAGLGLGWLIVVVGLALLLGWLALEWWS